MWKNVSLWNNVVFKKEVIFRIRIWGLKIKRLKAHNFVWQGYFFFHYYLATTMTDWAQIFTVFLFTAYVEIHQVRTLFLDNYQQCPMFLRLIFMVAWGTLVSPVFYPSRKTQYLCFLIFCYTITYLNCL